MEDEIRCDQVIFKCQLWLCQVEEKKLRSRLDDVAVTKEQIKQRLKAASQQLSQDSAQEEKELKRLCAEEQAMRQDLDDLSHEVLHLESRNAAIDGKLIEETERRDKLWGTLENVIYQRNHIRDKISRLDQAHLLVENALGGVLDVGEEKKSIVKEYTDEFIQLQATSEADREGSASQNDIAADGFPIYSFSIVRKLDSARQEEAKMRLQLMTLLHWRELLGTEYHAYEKLVSQESQPQTEHELEITTSHLSSTPTPDPTKPIDINSSADTLHESDTKYADDKSDDEKKSPPSSITSYFRWPRWLGGSDDTIEESFEKKISRLRVNMHPQALALDYHRRRKVLQQMCIAVQNSGLVHNRTRQGQAFSQCFSGAELVTWFSKSGVHIEGPGSPSVALAQSGKTNKEGQTFLRMLLDMGLADLIVTLREKHSLSCRAALYRFRSDTIPMQPMNGWLDTVYRWRVHRRWAVWNPMNQRLSLFINQNSASPKAQHWLGGKCIIKQVPQGRSKGVKYYFSVTLDSTQQGETLLFASDKASQRKAWLSQLWASGCSYPQTSSVSVSSRKCFPATSLDSKKQDSTDNKNQSDDEDSGGVGRREQLNAIIRQHSPILSSEDIKFSNEKIRSFMLKRASTRLTLAQAFATVPLSTFDFYPLLKPTLSPIFEEHRKQRERVESMKKDKKKQQDKEEATDDVDDRFRIVDSDSDDGEYYLDTEREANILETLQQTLSKVLSSSENPVGQLCQEFDKTFVGLYDLVSCSKSTVQDKKSNSYGNDSSEHVLAPKYLNHLLAGARTDLSSFVSHISSILLGDCVLGLVKSELTELLRQSSQATCCANAVKARVFSGKTYQILIELYSRKDQVVDTLLFNRIRLFKGVRFSGLGLNPALCLDEVFDESLESPHSYKSPGTEDVPIEDPPEQRSNNDWSKSSAYQLAIDKLLSIQTIFSPNNKATVVSEVAQTICASVDKHRSFQPGVVISADDLLLLFTYVICRAKVPHLQAHLHLVDDFLGANDRLLMSGYYLATAQAAVELILTHDLREQSVSTIDQTSSSKPAGLESQLSPVEQNEGGSLGLDSDDTKVNTDDAESTDEPEPPLTPK